MNDAVVSAQDEQRTGTEPDEQQAIAEYSKTESGLADLRARLKDRVYDVTTTRGLDEAKKDRAELRTLRVGLDKLRKQLNEDDQARINLRNGRAKEITAEIEKLESPIDVQIKAEEDRKEEARKERERQKAEELRKINEALSAIERLPLALVGATSEAVQIAIDGLAANTLEDFDEVHLPTAQHLRDGTLETLRRILDERVAAEAESARLAAERAELERLRAEDETRRQADETERAAADAAAQAERDRLAEEARVQREQEEQEAAARRAEQERQDEVRRAAEQQERDRVAAEQAERQRQLDEQEEQQRQQQAAAAEAERIERERAQALAAEREREQVEAAIAAATLREAAEEAYRVLCELGHISHITTRKLAAALAKEPQA